MFECMPSPFSIKGAWILTQARWFFETWVHNLLGLLAVWLKLLYSLPQQLVSQFIGLSCGKQYQLGLGNKCWQSQPEALLLRASQPQLGNFGVRPKQLSGPLVLWIFLSKFPKVPQTAPALGSGSKELSSGSWRVPYSRVSYSSVYSQKLCVLSIWVFFSRISQFSPNFSRLPCYREEIVAGLLPSLCTSLFVSLDASICVCLLFVCLVFVSLKNGECFNYPWRTSFEAHFG